MGTGAAYCTHTVRVRVLVHEFFPKSSNIYLGNLSINTGTELRVRVLHTLWWLNKYIFIYKVHISIMYTSWSSSDIITLNKINHTWSRGESQLHGTSASANHLCTSFWVADPQSCCFRLQALWYVYTCPPLPERKPFRHPGFGSFKIEYFGIGKYFFRKQQKTRYHFSEPSNSNFLILEAHSERHKKTAM